MMMMMGRLKRMFLPSRRSDMRRACLDVLLFASEKQHSRALICHCSGNDHGRGILSEAGPPSQDGFAQLQTVAEAFWRRGIGADMVMTLVLPAGMDGSTFGHKQQKNKYSMHAQKGQLIQGHFSLPCNVDNPHQMLLIKPSLPVHSLWELSGPIDACLNAARNALIEQLLCPHGPAILACCL